MKSRDIYAVVTTYSFSPDVTVRLYPTEDAAKAALINKYVFERVKLCLPAAQLCISAVFAGKRY